MQKEYQCICGAAFEKSTSLNGHRSTCKQYKAWKQEQLEIWISEEHKCENCGNIMTEYYGSGRFCSDYCAHSWTAKKQMENGGLFSKEYWTQEIREEHSKLMKKIMSNPEIKQKISETEKGRTLSDEAKQKISDKVKTSYADGRNKGWTTRKNQESYAEQFWKNVLENNNIEFQQEVKIDKPGSGCYFIDFLLPGNIDLEIDGKQHTYLNRIESDEKRDEFLTSNGYVVYRIPWNEINSETGKQLMKDKIDKFLSWYKSI